MFGSIAGTPEQPVKNGPGIELVPTGDSIHAGDTHAQPGHDAVFGDIEGQGPKYCNVSVIIDS